MVTVQSIDISGLQFLIGGLQNALIGDGADVSNITRDEARLLAIEIAGRVGPRDRAKKVRSIPGEIKTVFVPAPADKKYSSAFGRGDKMVWLNAGPDFLTGIDNENYRPDMNDIVWMERTFVKLKGKMGNKYKVVGEHGKQHVQKINRIMVKRGVFAKFVLFMISHLGRMKASWYATAKKLDPALVAPGWIARHIPNNPKAVTQLEGLSNHESPSVTFGSSALGIATQTKNVGAAVRIRKAKVAARLNLVLSGYAQDVKRGMKPRRHAKDYHADY